MWTGYVVWDSFTYFVSVANLQFYMQNCVSTIIYPSELCAQGSFLLSDMEKL